MKAGFKNLFGAAWARHTAFWIAILTMANLAFGQSSKMSPDLQALGPNSNVNVIVQYYNPPNGNELNAGGLIGADEWQESRPGQSLLVAAAVPRWCNASDKKTKGQEKQPGLCSTCSA